MALQKPMPSISTQLLKLKGTYRRANVSRDCATESPEPESYVEPQTHAARKDQQALCLKNSADEAKATPSTKGDQMQN